MEDTADDFDPTGLLSVISHKPGQLKKEVKLTNYQPENWQGFTKPKENPMTKIAEIQDRYENMVEVG